MTPTLTIPRYAVLAAFLCAGFAVQGCTDGTAQMVKPQVATPKEVVKPQPAPAVPIQTVTKAPRKAATVTRSAVQSQKREYIALSVSYMERILVPAGSELVLSATGEGSGPPSIKTTKTKSGPPYSVSMPVETGEGAYPMTVEATLTSTIGHVLSGRVTLTEKPTGPVEIIMHTKTD
ncbi:hypothetical protein OO012_10820 [Rhodobacteraceae bacterium KMM 6894]|nr:hypothetical protein [Rhodobacteraceae bacterium KMM 6894]